MGSFQILCSSLISSFQQPTLKVIPDDVWEKGDDSCEWYSQYDEEQPPKETRKMKTVEKIHELDPHRVSLIDGGLVDSFRLWVPFAEGDMEREKYLQLFLQRNDYAAEFKFIQDERLGKMLAISEGERRRRLTRDELGNPPTYVGLLKLGVGSHWENKLRKFWKDSTKRVDFALVVICLWIFQRTIPCQYRFQPYISLESFGARLTFGEPPKEAKRRPQISIYIQKKE